ncbi:hypothetical protein AAUPMC_12526, partial [Pasteurella multocida subsp. multocida str. Anand1_cattle]
DGSLIIEGSANLRDLNKLFDWNLDTEDARTFNGLILEHLEKFQKKERYVKLMGYKSRF